MSEELDKLKEEFNNHRTETKIMIKHIIATNDKINDNLEKLNDIHADVRLLAQKQLTYEEKLSAHESEDDKIHQILFDKFKDSPETCKKADKNEKNISRGVWIVLTVLIVALVSVVIKAPIP